MWGLKNQANFVSKKVTEYSTMIVLFIDDFTSFGTIQRKVKDRKLRSFLVEFIELYFR